MSLTQIRSLDMPTTAGEVYRATSRIPIGLFRVTNTTAGGVAATIWIVKAFDTRQDRNQQMGAQSISANTSSDLRYQDDPWILEPGDSIHALAGGAGLVLHLFRKDTP